ncbi:hypothetical protein CC86DRAFT_442734 [Ophiobolus disseminans]|uniref:WKF domain-containing protein n=1 Tax=Ophiobolus disseminans TaxID=1469910 RepID=A0A6A7AGV1_9PLEO|nr:hypothetical protein CC86DRAFT_442734 [Ophiobolus disseminans]
MPENGTRIPAWRRLGLALKNETQSGVTAPEPSASVADQQHVTPYDAQHGSRDTHQAPIEPTVNGKSSKLGKRKHQHEPAEDGQTSKRGRTEPETVDSTETTTTEATAPASIDIAEPISADAEQPKGDPNYRKKKAKPKQKRRDPEHGQAEQTPAPKPAARDRSSLSPGAEALPPKKGRRTLLASTETDHDTLAPTSTPHQHHEGARSSTKDPSGSPSGIDRRKSVTFTPDTKRVDGHSAQNLFKKWAADQKGVDANSTLAELEERAQFLDREAESKQKKKEQAPERSKTTAPAKSHQEKPPATNTAPGPAKSKGKKKDPSTYTSYLAQYHTNRDNWKFNKAKQNDVIDNAVNIFRIPEEHSEALLEYVQGLKGPGAIELLTSKCEAAIRELDAEDAKEPPMDDSEARKAMHDEALQARIDRERKRRKVEGDMEALATHPHGDNFIRRLRRERAEALLTALGRTSPILPVIHTNSINPLLQNLAPKRDSKKRKRRGDVSSDDSSSDSSSSDDDSSSDESGSEDAGSEAESSSSEGDNGSDDKSLPTELIETIATYLDLSSSRSLRLASRSLQHQSQLIFRDRFFHTRSILWTKHDLDQIVDISKHPEFGVALQHLRINATPKHSISLWQLRRRIQEADSIISETDGVYLKSVYIKEEEEANELATFFNETRYDQQCLRKVFKEIGQLESVTFEYDGMSSIYGNFGRRYCETSQHEMSRPFISIMAAIADSGIHVRTICTNPELNHGAVSIGRLESLAPALRSFDAAFEKLGRLELTLRDWRFPDTGFELESARAPFVVRFLAKASNVKYLSLDCYSSLDDDLMGEIARHCNFTKLETCKLAHFRLNKADDLYQLLAPSYPTLQNLSLSHILLRNEESTWADLLRHLASSSDTLPVLERIYLRKPFTGSRTHALWKPICIGEKGHRVWREQVPLCIERLREVTSGPAWHIGATTYPFDEMGMGDVRLHELENAM